VRYDESMRTLVAVALALLVVTPTAAQQVEIEKPAPPPARRERERAVIAPGLSGEGRPIDADNYVKGGRVPYEPGFIRGLSSERETPTSTGRIGIAGWTAPNTPVGSPATGWGEVNGWFAIGLSVTWDGPPPARPTKPQGR
jgi:hypothetical protein